MSRVVFLALLFCFAVASIQGGVDVQADDEIPKRIVPSREESEVMFYRGYFNLSLNAAIGQPPPSSILAAAQAKKRRQLSMLIEDIDHRISLSEEQKKKLHAAGELDIRRFFMIFEELKNYYVDGQTNADKKFPVAPFMDRLNGAKTYEANLFGTGSYFSKVSRSTLEAKQLDNLRQANEEREQSRWKTRCNLVVLVCGDGLGMNDEQKRKLSDLIIEKIPPPAKLPGRTDDYSYIFYKLTQCSHDQLKSIFDDAQWKVFNEQLAGVNANTKKRLIQWGYDLGEGNDRNAATDPEPSK